jgi:hypothetical protein
MIRYDIMHRHDNLRDAWPFSSLSGGSRLKDAKIYGYHMRDYIKVPVGVSQGTIERAHCSGNEKDKLEQLDKQQYLPVETYPSVLLRFYDTYTYYIYT